MGAPEEERFALMEKAKQTDPKRVDSLACRAQAALDEYNEIKAQLESTSSQTREKRLSKLLGRKGIEFDEAMNDIAVIASKSRELLLLMAEPNEGTEDRFKGSFFSFLTPFTVLVTTQFHSHKLMRFPESLVA